MNIAITTNTGKHVLEVNIPSRQIRKYKEFLINEFQRLSEEEDDPNTIKLLFFGGEWNIPMDKAVEMYKEIIRGYGKITSPNSKSVVGK